MNRLIPAHLKIEPVFRRQMLPLALFVGLFVAIALPSAHFFLKRSDLRSQGLLHAERVAAVVKELADTRPQFWRYDAAKLGRSVMLHHQRGVKDVRVLDHDGVLLLSTLQEMQPDLVSAGVVAGAPVLSNNKPVAWVEVIMDTAELYRTTILLSTFWVLVGILLASGLYRIPVRIIRRAEDKISISVEELGKARRENAVALREEERRRISRDLHDGVAQSLTSLRIGVELAGDAKIAQQVDAILDEIRRIARDLRPPLLDGLGLAAALEQLAQDYRGLTGHGCTVAVKTPAHFRGSSEVVEGAPSGGGRAQGLSSGVEGLVLSRPAETALFRIAQEALNNAARHGGGCAASVRLELGVDGLVRLMVRDQGSGFNLDHKRNSGLGLVGMLERAALCGGAVDIITGPGQGTTVKAEVGSGYGEGAAAVALATHGGFVRAEQDETGNGA